MPPPIRRGNPLNSRHASSSFLPSGPLSRTRYLLATALWIATVQNFVTVRNFFRSSSAGDGLGAVAFAFGGWLFVLLVIVLLLAAAGLALRGRALKAMYAALLLAGGVLSYFSTFLGTQFDKTMVLNIAQTHVGESLELINLRMIAWVALAGVLPAVLAWRATLSRTPGWLRHASQVAAIAAVLAVLTAAVVYAQYPRYASAIRLKHATFHTVAPANLIAAGISHAAAQFAAARVRMARGTDAHPEYAIPKPRLLVFVLGETARAQNHGLNGYLRDTTPRMRASGGYYFPDTESCGTATAISVPCIFSGFSREEFSLLRGLGNETLIDVVKRSGARVIWRDNDAGCKGVCDSAEFLDLTGASDPRWCPEPGECHDEILLDGLESAIRQERRDTLVVLHLKGSHGPAYHRRYPPAFEVYTPACTSSDLSSCDEASLRNAYDNTIRYTDHVVGETIRMLGRLGDRYAPALLYVSDHGESLGESGLYLHGMPYAVAPAEQTRVPLFAWVSRQFVGMERWDTACMARQAKVRRSHDNVYATVLGLLDVETAEYKPALDLFEPCDPPKTPAGAGRK